MDRNVERDDHQYGVTKNNLQILFSNLKKKTSLISTLDFLWNSNKIGCLNPDACNLVGGMH